MKTEYTTNSHKLLLVKIIPIFLSNDIYVVCSVLSNY
nr:MAG TPA: hypothetical protein [Caudoviricetes sp.]